MHEAPRDFASCYILGRRVLNLRLYPRPPSPKRHPPADPNNNKAGAEASIARSGCDQFLVLSVWRGGENADDAHASVSRCFLSREKAISHVEGFCRGSDFYTRLVGTMGVLQGLKSFNLRM